MKFGNVKKLQAIQEKIYIKWGTGKISKKEGKTMGLFKSKAERWFEEGKNLLYRQNNIKEGVALLEQSAEQKFAPAMMMLAEMYHSGQVSTGSGYNAASCPQNEARALELYQKLPDCLPVLARKAEIYYCGDDEVQDDAKALQIFQEIQSRAGEKENRKLFDLLGIMRLWRSDISGETLAIDAGAYIAAMRFWGRGGLEEDIEQSYNALELYVHNHEKTDEPDGDLYFCYAALGYRREGQSFLLHMERLERLIRYTYRRTANTEIKRILKEEMLSPSLKEMFDNSIRQGRLSLAKDCMSMMMVICAGDEELRAQFGEFLFGILSEETDRFATTGDYKMLIGLLEQCSMDFDSIRMSCHLTEFYLTHTITRTRTQDGEVQEVKTIKFDDSVCKVMSRLCEQLERLQKSETDLKEKVDLAFWVKCTLCIYDLKLKNIAPDDFKNIYRLSNMIQDEWRAYIEDLKTEEALWEK